MSKIAYHATGISLAAALALGFSSAASAADPQLVTHKDLSLAMAITMAQTAVETCKGQGYKVSVHVLGRNAEVIVALRGDGTGPHTLENSMKKAYTARTFGMPSGKFADRMKDNPTSGAAFLTNVVAAQGALPIMAGDEVIGAIGVSGAPGGEKDEACAAAGIEKVSSALK